jgi:hypothetical protein
MESLGIRAPNPLNAVGGSHSRSAMYICAITYHPWRGEPPHLLRSINMQLLAELGILHKSGAEYRIDIVPLIITPR